MSAPTAVGRVSESLRNLLLGEMSLTPEVPVTLLAPDEQGGQRRVNLFLYKVHENPYLRNQDWQLSPDDPTRIVPPPLSLNLYYLLTPYAKNQQDLGNATLHEILGEAMRVFYEHAIVPDEFLAGGLDGAREQIKIVQNGLDMEELSQVWSTFSEPFRLSVLYEVSVVQLDQSTDRPLPPRVREIGPPRVGAPYRPPVVEAMEPGGGPPGTEVIFSGRGLDGWSARVEVGSEVIADGEAIEGESFRATLPADLTPGFHEIRVDVSRLHRRTFFFEVTP